MSKAAGTGQVPGYPGTVKHVILELLAPAKLPATPTLPTQNKLLAPAKPARFPATFQMIVCGPLCQGISSTAAPAPAKPADPAQPAKPATFRIQEISADVLCFFLFF